MSQQTDPPSPCHRIITNVVTLLLAGFGLVMVFTGPMIMTTLSLSLLWILNNAIPPYLLPHYNFI
jgi:hypothetical protein